MIFQKNQYKKACNFLEQIIPQTDIKIEKLSMSRSAQQNRALHLYFEHVTIKLNELGYTFNYTGLTKDHIEVLYTPNLVKECIWKPLQWALFKKESTTQLTTEEINQIYDIINKFFSDRGIYIPFPGS